MPEPRETTLQDIKNVLSVLLMTLETIDDQAMRMEAMHLIIEQCATMVGSLPMIERNNAVHFFNFHFDAAMRIASPLEFVFHEGPTQ